MGKWTRRAFITTGVLAGGVVVFGVAIRRGDRAENVRGLVANEGDALFHVARFEDNREAAGQVEAFRDAIDAADPMRDVEPPPA